MSLTKKQVKSNARGRTKKSKYVIGIYQFQGQQGDSIELAASMWPLNESRSRSPSPSPSLSPLFANVASLLLLMKWAPFKECGRRAFVPTTIQWTNCFSQFLIADFFILFFSLFFSFLLFFFYFFIFYFRSQLWTCFCKLIGPAHIENRTSPNPRGATDFAFPRCGVVLVGSNTRS